MSSKKNNNWAILAFSPYRYEVNDGSHFPVKKRQNQSIRGQITFGIQLQTFPLKCNTRKLQYKTWNTANKNSFQQRRQLYPPIRRTKREAVTSFLHLCLNHILAPGQWHVCISKSARLFLVFAGQKHISGTRRATDEQVHWQAPLATLKAQLLQYTK